MSFNAETTPHFVNQAVDLPAEEVIFGVSKTMDTVRKNLERIAGTNVPIFLRGEAGAGKEIVARYIHRCYPGQHTSFIKVKLIFTRDANLDEALFDLQKDVGSRTDQSQHDGDPSECNCTLFIEEVADLNLDWQKKLKQLLQEDQPQVLQGVASPLLRPRVICASSRPMELEVEANRFRQDLFYCINVVSVCIPPLRERREDIPVLADYFLESYRAKFGRNTPSPSAKLKRLFQQYPWPGNIRELENLTKRYVLLGAEEIIVTELTATSSRLNLPEPSVPGSICLKQMTRQATRELERKIIFKVLRENHGNRTLAARALNISYRALLYKLKEADASAPHRRPAHPEEPDEDVPSGRSTRYSGSKEGVYS